jgi:hypothetical protein
MHCVGLWIINPDSHNSARRFILNTTKLDLSQFYGTENYWRTHKIFAPELLHTDGVQYFADEAGAYWFLDIVATEYFPMTEHESLLSIQLAVEDGKADICVEDGDCKVLKQKHISLTDCPDGLYKFFLTNNVLMLTSEY